MTGLTRAGRRALEQVAGAGKHGLLVERGWESVTQAQLVQDGLLWQEVHDRHQWKFTLAPAGRSLLQPKETR